jgi:hypothetical protein
MPPVTDATDGGAGEPQMEQRTLDALFSVVHKQTHSEQAGIEPGTVPAPPATPRIATQPLSVIEPAVAPLHEHAADAAALATSSWPE